MDEAAATGKVSNAPAAALKATAEIGEARREGTTKPVIPAAKAERAAAPTLRGSSKWSNANRAGRPVSRSSSRAQGMGRASAATPCGAAVCARPASEETTVTSAPAARARSAKSSRSRRPRSISNLVTRPAAKAAATARAPSTLAPMPAGATG